MLKWIAAHPTLEHLLFGLGIAMLTLLAVGIFMRSMEDFDEGQKSTIAKQIWHTMMLGLVAVIPIAGMFACTWLIQQALRLLNVSFSGEYGLSFCISLFLVLGGFYYFVTRDERKPPP